MSKSEEMVVEFENLSYAYGSTLAVKGITLKVKRGDFVALVGPNGSGKSTLIKLALGLLKPSSGHSRLLGINIEHFSQWHKIGYVPQVSNGIDARLPMTVAEVVAHGRYRGFSPLAFWKSTVGADVDDALETVGASHLKGRRIGELSAGQQQRILIARALVKKPEVFMLDEPVGGVDVHGEEQLYALLRSLNGDGITIIMVSHDIGAVMRESKTVACMNQTLVFHGEPHDLTRDELARLYGFPVEVLLHDALHEHR
jgi:zinc transport system ATP-binding protein